MKKNEIKKIENQIEELMNDLNYEIERNEENQKFIISDLRRKEILSYLDSELSEEEENLFFEKKIQIHNKIDRDIKIDSKKIDNFNIKLIYHRKKDDSLEYRIFISYKNEDNKLIRNRLRNSKIDSISDNKEKMIEYYNNLKLNEIKKSLSI